jgi:hypothetical protein
MAELAERRGVEGGGTGVERVPRRVVCLIVIALEVGPVVHSDNMAGSLEVLAPNRCSGGVLECREPGRAGRGDRSVRRRR